MRIEPWDSADEKTALACYEVYRAAHMADEPHEPPASAALFRILLHEGYDRTPGETWVASEDGHGVVGYYRICLPDLENPERASNGPLVHPAARRRGIGRALLRHEAERAAASERTVLSSMVVEDSAGEAFARALGATPELTEVRRVQDLEAIPPGKIAGLRASADRAAVGYSLVSWTGEVPEKYLGPLAEVFNAFADAPRGEGVQPEVWTADRIAERLDRAVRVGIMRAYSVAAMHEATGEMAGYSEVIIDPESPEWAFQQLTAVTRPHRGHRLGLLTKTAMLELLAREEPQLKRIQTGNAASNEHMIDVNDQLGYEVARPGWRFYSMPVAKIRQS